VGGVSQQPFSSPEAGPPPRGGSLRKILVTTPHSQVAINPRGQSPLPPANPPSPFANGVSPLSPPLALMPLLVGSVPLRIQSPVRETDFHRALSWGRRTPFSFAGGGGSSQQLAGCFFSLDLYARFDRKVEKHQLVGVPRTPPLTRRGGGLTCPPLALPNEPCPYVCIENLTPPPSPKLPRASTPPNCQKKQGFFVFRTPHTPHSILSLPIFSRQASWPEPTSPRGWVRPETVI